MKNTTHIIGAGIAGLSAGFYLAKAEHKVIIYESSKYAGGRCRSYYDTKLGCELDNGNHLLLGANKNALQFINDIGAMGQFDSPTGGIDMFDIASGDNCGDNWNAADYLNIPSGKLCDYLRCLKLLFATKNMTVEQTLSHTGALYRRMWQPLAVSILNTPLDTASATMLRSVMIKLLLAGKSGMRLYIPKISWGNGLIKPAIAAIEARSGKIHYNQRISSFEHDGDKITMLHKGEDIIRLNQGDRVIIATPASVAAELLPTLIVPTKHHAIVNVHFKAPELAARLLREKRYFWGIVGGTAEWFFVKDGVISSTTSAADNLAIKSKQEIAELIWRDLQNSLGIDTSIAAYRVLTEKRATFACTPQMQPMRPQCQTAYSNLFLVGDYTATKLPATIESAVISGKISNTWQ